MRVQSAEKTLDRTRLCELGRVERGKHIRWTKAGLLTEKSRYGELDLIRAAALDELTRRVKPSLAQAAWRQITVGVDAALQTLDVVISPDTRHAQLVRSVTELDQALPRNQLIVVVALAPRIEEARKRLREYRAITSDKVTAPARAEVPLGDGAVRQGS